MIDDEPGREASKERVATFFDKDRPMIRPI